MSFCDWIDQNAETCAEQVAISFRGETQTYAELAGNIARLATAFENEFGISQGDRVAYLGNNSPRIIEALFACARIGATFVPLNWRLALPELVQIVADSGARLLIVGEEQADTGAAITDRVGDCKVVGADSGPGSDIVARQNRDRSDMPVLMLYTSGTTGRPKGVVLTQAALDWSARNSIHMHGMTAADRVLTALPMFHAGGLSIQTLPALRAGATVVLHEAFSPATVLASISNDKPTLAGLVPAQTRAMVGHPEWFTTDMSALRSVTTGSTFVPDSCIDPWNERGVSVIQVYGATETCAVAIHQTVDNVDATVGSVGFPAKHCEVRIDAPDGQHGEILVKGPSLFTGYWHDPDATAEALQDGWFSTGDIGYCRADGAYVISDRKKDMIISGGENIYPAELESILDEHPQIAEAAVVGQADERWGEVPVAIIVAAPGSELDADDVRAMFDDRLARFKHPQRVMLVEKLPRNAMGKVEKFELRRQVGKAVES